MRKLQCEICGGTLKYDASSGDCICEYCGMVYPGQYLKEKVSNIRGNVKIDGPVTVQGVKQEKEYLIEAQKLMETGLYSQAMTSLIRAINLYPTNPEFYWLRAECLVSKCINENYSYSIWNELDGTLYTANSFHKDPERFSRICCKYTDYIVEMSMKTDNWINQHTDYMFVKNLPRGMYTISSIEMKAFMADFKTAFIQKYRDAIISGTASPALGVDALEDLIQIGFQNARDLTALDEYVRLDLIEKHIIKCAHASRFPDEPDGESYLQFTSIYSNIKGFERKQLYHICFFLGNCLIVRFFHIIEGQAINHDNSFHWLYIKLDKAYTIAELKGQLLGSKWSIPLASAITTDKYGIKTLSYAPFFARYNMAEVYVRQLCPHCGSKLKHRLFKPDICPSCHWERQ